MLTLGQKKTVPRVVLGRKGNAGGISLGVKRPAVMPIGSTPPLDGGVRKSPLEK